MTRSLRAVALSTRALERILVVALSLTVLDTAYLSWRYVALHADLVVPGTGLCSWTAGIDCDAVLRTPQARAFFVPNALLGFGYFAGCLLWWIANARLGSASRRDVTWLLAFWLCVASAMTLRFWWLLLHLDALCPFCPWNHVLTWIACAASVALARRAGPLLSLPRLGPLLPLVAVCVGQLFLWLALWGAALRAGALRP